MEITKCFIMYFKMTYTSHFPHLLKQQIILHNQPNRLPELTVLFGGRGRLTVVIEWLDELVAKLRRALVTIVVLTPGAW